MPDSKPHRQAYKRILKVADRNHLYAPFKTTNNLRAKHFPGAGPHISRTKLQEAYVQEFTSNHPDLKLLEHGTWPWLEGYADSLAFVLSDLTRAVEQKDARPAALPSERYGELVKKFTRVGAEEIAAFWHIFSQGDPDYQKVVIKTLSDLPKTETPQPPRLQQTGAPPKTTDPAPPQQPPDNVAGLDPRTRALYALIGGLIFFIPALLLVGIQYWRQPAENHWIVVAIASGFGLITLGLLIDFLRKRHL